MHVLRVLIWCVISFSIVRNAECQVQIAEINSGWQFRQVDDSLWHDAVVPGCVQYNLERLGVLPNKDFGLNEAEVQWVEQKSWVFRNQFVINNKEGYENIELEFLGIDTYAKVYLNGTGILHTDNMFKRWDVDITQLILDTNVLEIVFTPPQEYHRENEWYKKSNLPHDFEKARPLSRKAAFHFGWDWGPRFGTMGVFRPIRILSKRPKRLERLTAYGTVSKSQTAELHFEIDVERPSGSDTHVELFINDSLCLVIEGHNSIVRGAIAIPGLSLWNPIGYGRPNIHDLRVELRESDTVLDTREKKIGFRNVALNRNTDNIGTNFQFEINGNPVFCKGANYIPISHYHAQHKSEDYRALLSDLAKANMNTVRVWGGGVYEEGAFYELCDSLGIMVWQDFMFANTMYPPELNKSIREEVEYNVSRLSHHPSIIHWCGNNEIDVAWENWGWQERFGIGEVDSLLLIKNYERLFLRIIPNALSQILPYSTYSHTSPLSNWGKSSNYDHLTMHDWSVYHGDSEFSKYGFDVGRFVSEYGFQSYPNWSSMKEIIQGKDTLSFLEHRQKSYKRNEPIERVINYYFNSEGSIKKRAYQSQICQALGVGYAIQNHRINLDRCSGSLYWQLNDVWPAISWSSIDHSGEWKALHYEAKRKFREPGIYVDTTRNEWRLVLANTSSDTLWEIVQHGYDPDKMVTDSFAIAPNDIAETNIAFPEDAELYYVHAIGEKEHLSFIHCKKPYKDLDLSTAKIHYASERTSYGYRVSLHSEEPMLGVYLSTEMNGIWSDNYFDLIPGITKEIHFETDEKGEETLNIDVMSINHILRP